VRYRAALHPENVNIIQGYYKRLAKLIEIFNLKEQHMGAFAKKLQKLTNYQLSIINYQLSFSTLAQLFNS
jgi:hypothetical protein